MTTYGCTIDDKLVLGMIDSSFDKLWQDYLVLGIMSYGCAGDVKNLHLLCLIWTDIISLGSFITKSCVNF